MSRGSCFAVITTYLTCENARASLGVLWASLQLAPGTNERTPTHPLLLNMHRTSSLASSRTMGYESRKSTPLEEINKRRKIDTRNEILSSAPGPRDGYLAPCKTFCPILVSSYITDRSQPALRPLHDRIPRLALPMTCLPTSRHT